MHGIIVAVYNFKTNKQETNKEENSPRRKKRVYFEDNFVVCTSDEIHCSWLPIIKQDISKSKTRLQNPMLEQITRFFPCQNFAMRRFLKGVLINANFSFQFKSEVLWKFFTFDILVQFNFRKPLLISCRNIQKKKNNFSLKIVVLILKEPSFKNGFHRIFGNIRKPTLYRRECASETVNVHNA